MPEEVAPRSFTLSTMADEEFNPERSSWVEKVGESPQVYYFHNFLTDAERQHMIEIAAPQMRRSQVVGTRGGSVVDDIRTSYGMFIRRKFDPVIDRIEKRISLFTHIPVSHQEDIQVLRYTRGQKYGAHYDSAYSKDDVGPKFRLATFYMYLSDVEEGGETAFPEGSKWTDPSLGAKLDPSFSECAKGHVAARPKANDAVLFYSFFANGTMDMASMHTGCPVVKGIKWGAPVWIHVDEFRPEELIHTVRNPVPQFPGVCEDNTPDCAKYKAQGECERENSWALSACKKTCKTCEACKGPRDYACLNRNRRAESYLEIDREEMRWLGVNLWQEDPEEETDPSLDPSPEL